jgi:hypothetical protein
VRYSAEPAGLQRREDMEVRSEEAQGFDMTLSRTIPGPLMCLTMATFPVFLHNFKFLALGLVFLSLVTSFLPFSWACSSVYMCFWLLILSFTSVLRAQHRRLVASCISSRATRAPCRVRRALFNQQKRSSNQIPLGAFSGKCDCDTSGSKPRKRVQ